jgi:hypothetical protein
MMQPRNPFGVMDVPDPNDPAVEQFAATVALKGDSADDNAEAWCVAAVGSGDGIAGDWCSRWNGGADPTIPGDAAEKWKQGRAQAREVGARVYLLFEWDDGRRRGLIDALRAGQGRLVGKYVNLTNQSINRAWVGLIVSDRRIDGRWTGGRLDFRR